MDEQPNRANIRTVIAARPGTIRGTLRAALALFPRLEISGVAGGGLSALSLVRRHNSTLLIIDAGLSEDEVAALLKQVKVEQPHVWCLVLAETTRQKERLLSLGANAVVLRNEPAEHLVENLNEMELW